MNKFKIDDDIACISRGIILGNYGVSKGKITLFHDDFIRISDGEIGEGALFVYSVPKDWVFSTVEEATLFLESNVELQLHNKSMRERLDRIVSECDSKFNKVNKNRIKLNKGSKIINKK